MMSIRLCATVFHICLLSDMQRNSRKPPDKVWAVATAWLELPSFPAGEEQEVLSITLGPTKNSLF